MKQMKVVDRANRLLDEGLESKEALGTLLAEATPEEKIEWFDEVAGKYLIYQLAYERGKSEAGAD